MKTKLRKSIDATFYNGLFDIVIKSLTTGPMLTAYALSLGIGNFLLGFLQSVIPFSNIIHLPVSYLLEKGRGPKKIACISSLLSRPLLALLGLSFFFRESSWAIPLFVGSYVLFYLMVAVTGGAFWPWCKELVPKSLTTSFFAHRIRYILLIKIITVTLATSFLSFTDKNHLTEKNFVYPLLLFLAFILGLFYTYTLFQIKGIKLQNRSEKSFSQKLLLVLKKKDFIHFFLKIGFVNYAVSFFTPFVMVFLVQELKLDISTALFFSVGSGCIDILCLGFWKKYAYQNNLGKMLFSSLSFFLLAIIILIFLSVYKIYIYPILCISFVLIGIGTSGVNLAISDASVSYVPHQMSSIYISLMNIGRFGFSGIASLLAGLGLETVGDYTSYKWLLFFFISWFLFVFGSFFAKNIKPIEK